MTDWLLKKINFVSTYVAIAVLFFLVALSSSIEIKDLDLWLHIASGRYILAHHQIPSIDVFSCTLAQKPWINHEWLFQVIVYSIHKFWGPDGLINMQVGVVLINFGLLLFLAYGREARHPQEILRSGFQGKCLAIPITLLLLILLVYETRFTIRPDIFSLLFLTLDVVILWRYLDRGWSLWAVMVIQILWTNMHGFFIFGPLIFGMAFLSQEIKKRVPLLFEWNTVEVFDEKEYRQLKKIFCVAILACLVNPCFIKGALYPLQVIFSLSGDSKIFFAHIGELERPIQLAKLFSFDEYPQYKLLIIFSSLSFVVNYRKINLTTFVLWVVFLLFSLSAKRNIVFFSLIAYFVFLENVRYFSWEQIMPASFNARRVQWVGSLAFKIFIIVWMLNDIQDSSTRGYFDFDKFERKSEYHGVSLRDFPFKAVDFLVDNRIDGNFFNDFNSGAYLLGRTAPEIKVFMDGRTEVYGGKFFQRYEKIWKGDKKLFQAAVEQYSLTGAFLNSVRETVPAKTLQHLYNNKDWALVYFDYDAAIFLRDVPHNHGWIQKYRIDLSRWHTAKVDLLKFGITNITPYQNVSRAKMLFGLKFFDQAEEEVRQALRVSANDGEAYKILGKVNIKKEEYQLALENLRKARLLDLSDMEIRYNLGLTFYHLGDLKKARKECQQVLEANAKNPKGLFLSSLIYVKQKKYEEAFKVLNEANAQSPETIDDLVPVAEAFLEGGEWAKAKRVYAMALTIDPENKEIKNKMEQIK